MTPDTYEARDPDTDISVSVMSDVCNDRILYRFSTDAEYFAVPEDFFEIRPKNVPMRMIATELLVSFASLRPYAFSKFALMQ